MAFQLVDDLLDFEGDPAETGKDLFADLLQGKLTWPLILAAERDAQLVDEVRDLSARAAKDELSSSDAAAIIARIRDMGTVEETRELANQQRAEAHQALRHLPPSDARDAVAAVVDAAVDRHR